MDEEYYFDQKRKKQTKHQSIYGIFAEDVNEEEAPLHLGLGAKSYSIVNSSKGLNFVSTGSEKLEIDKEFGKHGKEKKLTKDSHFQDSTVSLEPLTFSSTSTIDPFSMSCCNFFRRKSNNADTMKEVDLPTQMDPNFAAWTKHTKGIGLKLLLKEGHEVGKGLGKDKTGIVYPLQAQLREGKSTGLGYAAQDKSYQKEPLEPPKPQGIPSWKKGASCEPLSHMHAYKTQKKSRGLLHPDSSFRSVTYEQVQRQTKVIDMRGPQIREFTNYHEMSKAINHETNDFDGVKMSSVSFPELKHNLRLLVDISCNDLGEIESKITMEEDSLYLLKEEMKKLQKFSLKEKEKLTKLIEIKNMIHQYENSTKTLTEKLKLEKCVALFHSLQNTYSREFVAYDLTGLCSALVYPLVQEHLAAWEPHEKPKYGVEMFLLWREILLPPTSVEELALHNREMHDYERMLWDLWLPRIRDSVDLWNPRDYKNNKILKLFEKWRDVIPNWLFHYTLDHLVFSKLCDEVLKWNPLTDYLPLHLWLLPWIPLMCDRMNALYQPIQQKLSNALEYWNPSDQSAHALLSQWKEIFPPKDMERLLLQSIVPRLHKALMGFVINPRNQTHIDLFRSVMQWHDIVPAKHMCLLLEHEFFPKWTSVLVNWLNCTPNTEEVANWYVGWKAMIPEQLAVHAPIQNRFRTAIECMNAAALGKPVQMPQHTIESFKYFEDVQKQEDAKVKLMNQRNKILMQDHSSNITFTDVISKMAERNDILFRPLEKFKNGNKLYMFGIFPIYIERNVVFVQENETFIPVAVDKLIEKVKKT